MSHSKEFATKKYRQLPRAIPLTGILVAMAHGMRRPPRLLIAAQRWPGSTVPALGSWGDRLRLGISRTRRRSRCRLVVLPNTPRACDSHHARSVADRDRNIAPHRVAAEVGTPALPAQAARQHRTFEASSSISDYERRRDECQWQGDESDESAQVEHDEVPGNPRDEKQERAKAVETNESSRHDDARPRPYAGPSRR